MPKISALPIATGTGTGDLFVVDQSSITKRIDFNVLQSAIANAGVVQSLILQNLSSAIAQPVSAGNVNFTQSGTGAVQRTVQDKEQDVVSLFDFMTTAQKTDVKNRTRTLDVSSAINLAITACSSSKQALRAPAGDYLVNNPLTSIAGQFRMFGDGPQQTEFIFNTSGPQACFTLSNGALQVLHVVLEQFGINSTDTTNANVGIDCYDINTCAFRDLYIHGSRNASPGGSVYFGGANSVGIRVQGRDACNFHNIQINADFPYFIGANPNSAATNGEDMDHFSFTGYQYLNPVNQYAITVADGHGMQNTTFGPDLACVGGLGIFKINDTRVAPVVRSHHITFNGWRGEQATSSAGYWFNTSFATRCETFTIQDGEGDSTTQGFLSDRICNFICKGVIFARGSGDAVKITSPDSDAVASFEGCQFQPGANFTLTGYTASLISAFNSTDFSGPSTAVYVANTNQAGTLYNGGKVTANVPATTSGLEVSATGGGDRFQVLPAAANNGVHIRSVDDGITTFRPLLLDGAYTGSLNKIYPGTMGAAQQVLAGLYGGTGLASNAQGSVGDTYFRGDGGLGSSIYRKFAAPSWPLGSWTPII